SRGTFRSVSERLLSERITTAIRDRTVCEMCHIRCHAAWRFWKAGRLEGDSKWADGYILPRSRRPAQASPEYLQSGPLLPPVHGSNAELGFHSPVCRRNQLGRNSTGFQDDGARHQRQMAANCTP